MSDKHPEQDCCAYCITDMQMQAVLHDENPPTLHTGADPDKCPQPYTPTPDPEVARVLNASTDVPQATNAPHSVNGTVYTRVRTTDLITCYAENALLPFKMAPEHHMANQTCAAGCGRALIEAPVVMLPINVVPEDHRPVGYATAASVLVHQECLTPQPPELWRDVVGAAQRLAAHHDQPDKIEDLTVALDAAVALARAMPVSRKTPSSQGLDLKDYLLGVAVDQLEETGHVATARLRDKEWEIKINDHRYGQGGREVYSLTLEAADSFKPHVTAFRLIDHGWTVRAPANFCANRVAGWAFREDHWSAPVLPEEPE